MNQGICGQTVGHRLKSRMVDNLFSLITKMIVYYFLPKHYHQLLQYLLAVVPNLGGDALQKVLQIQNPQNQFL